MTGFCDPPHAPFSKDNQPANRGRKKGSTSVSAFLKAMMEQTLDASNPLTKKMEKMSVSQMIAMQLAVRAMKGDMRAIQEVIDRLEGKAVQFMVTAGIEKVEVEFVGSDSKVERDEHTEDEPRGSEQSALEDSRQSGRDAEQ